MVSRVAERFRNVALTAVAEASGSLEERAVAALDAVFHQDNRALLLAMHELLSIAPREPSVAEAVHEHVATARKLVAVLIQGQDDPEALRAAAQALAVVQGYISLWIWSGAGDPAPWRQEAERSARILLTEFASGRVRGRSAGATG